MEATSCSLGEPGLLRVALAGVWLVYIVSLWLLHRHSLLLSNTATLPSLLRLALPLAEVCTVLALLGLWVLLVPSPVKMCITVLLMSGLVMARAFMEWFTARGLVSFLSMKHRRTLLSLTLVEWFQDTSLMASLRKFQPLMLGLTEAELEYYMRTLTPEFRHRLTRKGLVHELPMGLRKLLLPRAAWAAVANGGDVSSSIPLRLDSTAAPLSHLRPGSVIHASADLGTHCGLGAPSAILTPDRADDGVRAPVTPSTARRLADMLSPESTEIDVTRDIVAQRVASSGYRLLMTADAGIIRVCAGAAAVAFLFNVASSRTARLYSVRAIKHGSTLALMVAAVSLSALAGVQAVAEAIAAKRQSDAAALLEQGPTHVLTAGAAAEERPIVVLLSRLLGATRAKKVLTLLPAATIIALLFFLMRLKVKRR